MPPKQKKPQVGIVFPPGPKGDRSTSAAGKGIIGASLKAVDAEAAAKCEKERNWRYGYNKHFLKHVKLGCSTPAAALAGAKAGLDYVYDNFEFIAKEGDAAVPLRDEMKTNKTSFCTGKFQGSGDRKGIALTIPYNGGYTQANQTAPTDKDLLKGTALKEQLANWATGGAMEPDAAAAVSFVSDYLGQGNDLSDCHFILIGAGSAMGPFGKLLEMGANIIALDIPGSWGGPRPSWKLWYPPSFINPPLTYRQSPSFIITTPHLSVPPSFGDPFACQSTPPLSVHPSFVSTTPQLAPLSGHGTTPLR